MLATEAIRLTYDALWLVLMLSAPPIIAASAVGLLVALLQAATQLQEQTLQYTVKFVVIVFTIFITASFVGGSLKAYTERVFSEFATLVRK